jgi:hypothetical protein
MARSGLRRLILSILAAWAQICQKWPQKAYFEHFGGLGPDMNLTSKQIALTSGPQHDRTVALGKSLKKARCFWKNGTLTP